MANDSRGERLQIMLTKEELIVLDQWRFSRHMPSRAAAVRELLRRGLSAEGFALANGATKSGDYGMVDGEVASGAPESALDRILNGPSSEIGWAAIAPSCGRGPAGVVWPRRQAGSWGRDACRSSRRTGADHRQIPISYRDRFDPGAQPPESCPLVPRNAGNRRGGQGVTKSGAGLGARPDRGGDGRGQRDER